MRQRLIHLVEFEGPAEVIARIAATESYVPENTEGVIVRVLANIAVPAEPDEPVRVGKWWP